MIKYNPMIFGIDIANIIESEKLITLSKFIDVPTIVNDKKINLYENLLNLLIPNKHVQHLNP